MILAANQLQQPDYIILAGYFALMLGIGIYFYRYMKGMKDFFSGGNSIPWWLSGVSFYMSAFSVFVFVGYSTIAYKYGWIAVALLWVCIPATFVSVVFFAKKWRRARIDSPVEYLEARYGVLVRQLFAWEGLPVRIIDDALKLVAIGIFVSASLGLGVKQCMFFSGVLMLVYAMLGGLWAVTVTDFIQFVVMAVAIVMLVPMSISEAGGVGEIFSGYEPGFLSLIHPPEYGTMYLLATLLLFILAYSSINWSLIQRYYCVPKEKDTRKVGVLVMALFFVGTPMILLPALLAPKFLDVPPDQDRMVYVLICLKLLPPGMMGLVIAAMLSATMSMLSSDYNVCASVLTNDIYRRLIHPAASQKELVLVGRLMTLLIGSTVLGVAFLMLNLTGEGLFRGMIKLFSIFTAPVGVPMILGLLWRKMNKNGALAGFAAGVGLGLMLYFFTNDEINSMGIILKKETILLFGTTALTSVVMISVSLLFKPSETEQKRAEEFLARLNIPVGQMDIDKTTASERGTATISPFRVVGVSIMLISVLMLIVTPYMRADRLAFGMNLSVSLVLLIIGTLITLRSGKKLK